MSSSRNEFIIGCLIGGVVGAMTAMLAPKKWVNGALRATPKASRRNATSTKSNTAKKAGSRRAVKPA